MQEIKSKNKSIGEYNCATTVTDGVAFFDLRNRINKPVFKTIYKDTAVFTTSNKNFVYDFSDCEVPEDNSTLLVRINKEDGTPANNIKVYLSVKGEKNDGPTLSAPLLITLLVSGILIGIAALVGVFFHAAHYAEITGDTSSTNITIYGGN